MSIHIAPDVALTEDADSLNHPYRQSVALAVHSAEASVFTDAAAQVESTPRGQVAVHRDRARHRACHARQVCRLRLRDRAACDQRPHRALTAAVTPGPAPQPPSPIRRKGSAPFMKRNHR